MARRRTGPDFDYLFNIILVGNPGVGKTTFLRRYVDGQFFPVVRPTIGTAMRIKTVQSHDKVVKLQIWDTGGQERYRSLTASHYRGCNGCFILFDVGAKKTFDDTTRWHQDVLAYCPDSVQIALVGTRCTEEARREVSFKLGQIKADNMGIDYCEVDSKLNVGIQETFEAITNQLLRDYTETYEKDFTSSFSLGDRKSKRTSQCSC